VVDQALSHLASAGIGRAQKEHFEVWRRHLHVF
jgi:hypothetical protein